MNDKELAILYMNQPEGYDQAMIEVDRLRRTIEVLVAAGFVAAEKVDRAYEIAGWK